MMKLKISLIVLIAGSVFVSCENKKEQAQDREATPEAPTMVLQGEEVTYSSGETEMIGYLAKNTATTEKRPGILVVHEWWGHNDYSRSRADQLATLGYTALAVDMYGDGKTADHPSTAGEFSSAVMGNIDEAKARFDQALAVLKADPTVDGDKIGVIGYCFGGTLALTMAGMGADVDAVVAFHAGLALPVAPDGEKLDAKILVCNGAADPFISQESEDNFVATMEGINADFELIKYDSAVHAFTNPGADKLGKQFDLPLAYQQEADEKSWQEMQKLFAAVFN